MAKARMLHNKISNSLQVNRLSLPARLLFTWMISHADDEGRIKGEAEYIKGKVFSMTEYKTSEIEGLLQEITKQGLIFRWEQEGNWYIEFPSWKDHQLIRKSRFHKSQPPTFSDSQMSSNVQPNVNQSTAQSNKVKSNKVKMSKSEQVDEHRDIKSVNSYIDPLSFTPHSAAEHAALAVWRKLEPDNPKAFMTTYLKAVHDGIPFQLIFQFSSEIKQDETIENPGKVFNSKVRNYLEEHGN